MFNITTFSKLDKPYVYDGLPWCFFLKFGYSLLIEGVYDLLIGLNVL